MAGGGGRTGARLLVLLVVLAALTAGVVLLGNTVGRSYLERQIATLAQTQAGLPSAPSVSVKDRLLVWSVARQRLDRVEVTAQHVPLTVAEADISPDIGLVLSDVSRSGDTYTAGSLAAEVRLSWSDAEKLAQVPLQKGDQDTVEVQVSTTLAGVQVSGTVSGRLIIDSQGRLAVTEPSLTLNGYQAPQSVVRAAVGALLKPVDLNLPNGLRATSVSVTDAGVSLIITGSNVDLSRLGR